MTQHPHMSPLRLVALTTLTMIAFAANSLFCRMALKQTAIGAVQATMFIAGFISGERMSGLQTAGTRINGGILFLGEVFTRDLLIASVLILGGIWLVLRYRR